MDYTEQEEELMLKAVVLEAMFGKLQAQAKEVTQLKCTLAKVAVQAESATRLEDKLKLLQGRLDEVLGPPGSESLLSPFKQQVMLDELGHLKTVVASHTLTIDGTVADISKNMKPRLEVVEAQLVGVDNLAGRMVAQDVLAEELGIEIPDLMESVCASASGPGAATSTGAPDAGEVRTLMRNATTKSRSVVVKTGRLARLRNEIEVMNIRNKRLQESLSQVNEDVVEMEQSHKAETSEAKQRLDALEGQNLALRQQADANAQLLLASAAKMDALDDLDKLKSSVHMLQRNLDEQEIAVKHIKTKDVERIDKQIFELKQSIQSATGMSENEMEMAEGLKLLERDLEMVKRKLSGGFAAALGADAQALTGAARQADLLEVVASVEQKADKADIRQMLRRAVASALEAYHAAAALAPETSPGGPGRALKFRCLSCDQDVSALRPRPLGRLPSPQGLLPSGERFVNTPRPQTASGPLGPGLNAASLRQQNLDSFARLAEDSGAPGGHSMRSGNRVDSRQGLISARSARTPVFA